LGKLYNKLTRVYIIVTVFNLVLFSLIYLSFPNFRQKLIWEDQLLEVVTALLFFCSFLAGLFLILELKERRFWKYYFIIPIIGLISFLEEVSYGQRIMNFEIPKFKEIGIDAIHDVILLFYQLLNRSSALKSYLSLIAAFIIIVLLTLKYYKVVSKVPDLLRSYSPLNFVMLFFGFMIIAQFIDIHIFNLIETGKISIFKLPGGEKVFVLPQHYEILWFFEELLELNGSIALLFASFSIKQNNVRFYRTFDS